MYLACIPNESCMYLACRLHIRYISLWMHLRYMYPACIPHVSRMYLDDL
jgi:hypothetical protein